MSKRQIIFIFFTLLFLLSACDPKFIQKAYVVNTPNVNCFQKDEEKNYKVAASLQSISFQTNWSLTNKYGISSSLFACGGVPWTCGFEIGGIYFKNVSNKFYFEIQTGYGYFSSKSDINRPADFSAFMGLYGRRYKQSSNTKYHKLYSQPSFFFVSKNISLGLALKIDIPYFTNYYWTFEDELSGERGIETKSTMAEFHDKFGLEFEPVFKLKFRRAFFIQIAKSYAFNSFTSDLITSFTHGNGPVISKYKNPAHSTVIINIGLEYKLEKRKKN